MLLAGDVGGTKTNLAIYSSEGGLTPVTQAIFESAEYPNLKAIVTEFLAGAGESVDKAAFGVPGPVVGGQVNVTNLPWLIRETTLQESLGLDEVKLLNDLEATAYGVPHLPSEDLFLLNDAPPQSGTKAVLAPGTGLGEAILFQRGDKYH
ncbi:MAG: glucokinase, partial [Anaerolineae bacterium]